jgi:hypothetical protein
MLPFRGQLSIAHANVSSRSITLFRGSERDAATIRGPSIKHHIQAQLDAVAGRPRARPAIRGPARPHFCAVEALPLPAPQRVASVDALRGFTMFWIIGADGAAKALAEMLSGKGMIPSTAGNIIDGQFEHAEWEGLRFYDLIFPLFIFVTGVAIVFSLMRLIEQESKSTAYWRVLPRSLLSILSHTWMTARFGASPSNAMTCLARRHDVEAASYSGSSRSGHAARLLCLNNRRDQPRRLREGVCPERGQKARRQRRCRKRPPRHVRRVIRRWQYRRATSMEQRVVASPGLSLHLAGRGAYAIRARLLRPVTYVTGSAPLFEVSA